MRRILPALGIFLVAFIGFFFYFKKMKHKDATVSGGESSSTQLVAFKGVVPAKHVAPIAAPAVCSFEGAYFPAETEVMYAGIYGGRALGFQIDRSGHEARQIDVTVNYDKPVALMLAAYEPTVWNIGWTKNTKIVAVHVNGYHNQVIAGIPQETPTLASVITFHGPCPEILELDRKHDGLARTSFKLFGKNVSQRYIIESNAVLIGNPLREGDDIVTSNWKTVESYRDDKTPLAGLPAIKEAVAKGILREPTEDDIKFLRAEMLNNHPGEKAILPGNPYLVLKDFTCPEGLYGANSVNFIIMKGVNRPTGNCGHADFYDLNKTPVCEGSHCVTNQQ